MNSGSDSGPQDLQRMLQQFQVDLQRQFIELTASIRKDVHDELHLFYSKAPHKENSEAQRMAEERPVHRPSFDGILPVDVGARAHDHENQAGHSSGLSVALACATFKNHAAKSKRRFPMVLSNTSRIPDVAAELAEVRSARARAQLANEAGRVEETCAGDVTPRSKGDAGLRKKASEASISTQVAMLGHKGSLPQTPEALANAPHEAEGARKVVGDFMVSPVFQNMIVAAIILHSICIAIASEVMARNVMDETPVVFVVLEVIFLVVFAAEVVLNIFVHRLDWFRKVTSEGKQNSSRLWNFVECALVASQLLDLIVLSISATVPTRISLLRTLRLARLLRIIRVFKVVRAVRDLRLIVYSMTRSFTVFFWSVIALVLATFFFGLIFTELVLHYKLRYTGRDTQELDRYFGSLTTSMISLFQAVTGGVDWGQVLEQADTLDHPTAKIALVFFVCFALFAIMNVITGVFLHTAMDRAKDEREVMLVRNARRVFATADNTGNGTITWSDFEKALISADMHEFFAEVDLEASEARTLFDLLDTTGDGIISAEEFLYGCLRLSGVAKAFDLLVLSREVSYLFAQVSSSQAKILENQQLLFQHLSIRGKPERSKTTGCLAEDEQLPATKSLIAHLALPGMCSPQSQ